MTRSEGFNLPTLASFPTILPWIIQQKLPQGSNCRHISKLPQDIGSLEAAAVLCQRKWIMNVVSCFQNYDSQLTL